jgi:hypothetical protein
VALVTILPCLLPVFEGESFSLCFAFGRHFSIPFCNFLLLSVRLLRPAAVAPPPPPPPAENFCNSYYMNESGVRCFFCPLTPPFPTAASAVSKCSRRRCNWPFFRNANNTACVAEKWSQLF